MKVVVTTGRNFPRTSRATLNLPGPLGGRLEIGQTKTFSFVDPVQLAASPQVLNMVSTGIISLSTSADDGFAPSLQGEDRQGSDGLRFWLRNRVMSGLLSGVATTPSTIADYNVDITAGTYLLDGTFYTRAAAVDFDYNANGYNLAGGAPLLLTANGKEYWGRAFVVPVPAQPLIFIFNYESNTGLGVAPPDGDIIIAMGLLGITYWAEIGQVLVERVAPGNITETWAYVNPQIPA